MRTMFLLTFLVASFALLEGPPPKVSIHELTDGSLIEGSARKTETGIRLTTPFGVRSVAAADYRGVSSVSPLDLRKRAKEMLEGVARKDAAQHRAVATWCIKNGYLTGLRKRLNHLLSLEVDAPWARKRVADLASVYTLHRTELAKRGRDRRKFVDFLFEKLAARDNVGAVLAVEKAASLDRELVYRAAMKALKRGKPRVRWAGARTLGTFMDEPLRISPLYKQSLRDGIWAVRREAVRALKVTGDEVFVRLYAKHLRSPEAMLRVRAAQALAELGMAEAVKPLISALADTWRPVRNYVAITNQIAYVKDYDVEVAQTAFIADPVVDVIQEGAVLETAVIHVSVERRLYGDALSRITGASLGTKPGAWRRWLDSNGAMPR